MIDFESEPVIWSSMLRRTTRLSRLGDQTINGRDVEAFVERLVEEGHWGGVAGTEALHRQEGEDPVLGGFVGLNSQFIADMVE
jgi:hypothetical protein